MQNKLYCYVLHFYQKAYFVHRIREISDKKWLGGQSFLVCSLRCDYTLENILNCFVQSHFKNDSRQTMFTFDSAEISGKLLLLH